MVQKFCPQCKDWIPVACKTCPCGHKFIKTATNKDRSKFEIEALNTAANRKENGRPKRISAMNSLYYHSALHVSSYKLAKHAAVVSAKKKRKQKDTDTSNSQSIKSETSSSTSPTSQKRKKGRPPKITRLLNASSQPKRPDIAPYLRNKLTGEFMDSTSIPNHSSELDSKGGKANKAVNDSESYNKLYKSLSDAQRQHYAVILAEINSKFTKNSNFPL